METFIDAELLTASFALGSAIVLLSCIVKGFGGFGVAMIAGPVLSALYTPVEGVAMVLLLEIATGLPMVPDAARRAAWRLVLPVVAACAVTVPLGAAVLVGLDADIMRRVIAGAALLFALVMLSGWNFAARQSVPLSAGIGAFSGAITGATGMGNPVLLLYALAGEGGPQVHRATILMLSFLMVLLATAALLASGTVSATAIGRAAVLIPFALVCVRLGSGLFGRASAVSFRRAVLAVVVATSSLALVL